jgi:hypothetical protein
MNGSKPFRLAYLGWLGLVWERLEVLDSPDVDADGPRQSAAFVVELTRLRREFKMLESALHTQCSMGRVGPKLEQNVRTLLHDLHWLLHVSPSASPVLARQCVRIAQDRVYEEVELVSDVMPPVQLRGDGRTASITNAS